MTAQPLISVLVPCHDHAAVLPWALASLVAQTHEAWECLVVDDGSGDRPRDVVEAFADPRIHFSRLDRNRGPAAARQAALERARGEYIAMLDADDWAYPDRLAAQLEVLAADPDLAAVGGGMAVVDAENQLLGVRGAVDRTGVSGVVRALPSSCGQATVMLRGEVARAGRFDPGLRRTEDADYLHAVLRGRRFRVLAGPLYVYREDPRGAALRSLRAHTHRRIALRKRLRGSSLRVRARLLDSYAKTAVYAAAHLAGLDMAVARARNRRPTYEQLAAFEAARHQVAAIVQRVGFDHAERPA